MAILSTLSEFTGGGVTWEGGFIEKVSKGLVGGLGMGEHEHLAAAAASTSATAPMVFRDNKNMKNDHHLRSRVGARINSTSPVPLSATMDTDAATTTIFTTPTSNGAKAGRGHGLGVGGDIQDGLSDGWANPYTHLVGVVSAILLLVGFIGFKGISWRNLKRESWIWIRLACLTPVVFVHHFWVYMYAAAHRFDVEQVEVGCDDKKMCFIKRLGGMKLILVERKPAGPATAKEPSAEGSTPRKPGRPPSGIGVKSKSLTFRQRAWRTLTTRFLAFVAWLSAFIASVRALGRDVGRYLGQLVDGIRRNLVTLHLFGAGIEPNRQDWIHPDLLKPENDDKGKKGDKSGHHLNKGKKNAGSNAGGKGGGKKGKARQR